MPEESTDPLNVVAEAVRAVVERDDERMHALAADATDLYFWTRDHGLYGAVELVIPPGAPSDWNIDWTDRHDGSKHVAVPMWTQQEGRSDLTLELELHVDEAGRWHARVSGPSRALSFRIEAGPALSRMASGSRSPGPVEGSCADAQS